MKKFVSMTDINSVFLTVEPVDYVTVKHVTDTMVDLNVYLKSGRSKRPELISRLNDCGAVLRKMLSRRVTFSVIPASLFSRFTTRLSNLLIK